MEPVEITNQALDALESNNSQNMAQYLTDDFEFIGPVPIPLNREQFIKLMSSVLHGVPDLRFNRSNVTMYGNNVHVTVDIAGTHTNELTLPIPGIPVIPPTNRNFRVPRGVIVFTIRDNKISKIEVENMGGGSIPGMLAQIGFPMSLEL